MKDIRVFIKHINTLPKDELVDLLAQKTDELLLLEKSKDRRALSYLQSELSAIIKLINEKKAEENY